MRTLKMFWIATVAALGVFAGAAAVADDSYREQMKGLDEQVQEVKSDVLSIAAELTRLEERLLYPSNTHLAVFVELAERDTLRLDAVQIQIDGQPVAHSIYSFKELEALQKGGVQRIYTGNVPTGDAPDRSVDRRQARQRQGLQAHRAFEFTKGIEPKLLGVTLGSSDLSSETGERMPRALTYILGSGLAECCSPGALRGQGSARFVLRRSAVSRAARAITSKRSSGSMPSSASITARRAAARLAVFPHRRSEFSVGDFELYYRMHHRAGRAIKAVLEGAVDEDVRNEAALSSRAHPLPERSGEPTRCTRSIASAARCRSASATTSSSCARTFTWRWAVRAMPRTCSRRLQGAESLTGFAAYNLGIALLQDDQQAGRGLSSSTSAGQLSVTEPARSRFATSRTCCSASSARVERLRARAGSFDRVRLDGPFSNQALLSAGWAHVSCRTSRERGAVGHSRQARSSPTPRCRKRCSRCRMPTAN